MPGLVLPVPPFPPPPGLRGSAGAVPPPPRPDRAGRQRVAQHQVRWGREWLRGCLRGPGPAVSGSRSHDGMGLAVSSPLLFSPPQEGPAGAGEPGRGARPAAHRGAYDAHLYRLPVPHVSSAQLWGGLHWSATHPPASPAQRRQTAAARYNAAAGMHVSSGHSHWKGMEGSISWCHSQAGGGASQARGKDGGVADARQCGRQQCCGQCSGGLGQLALSSKGCVANSVPKGGIVHHGEVEEGWRCTALGGPTCAVCVVRNRQELEQQRRPGLCHSCCGLRSRSDDPLGQHSILAVARRRGCKPARSAGRGGRQGDAFGAHRGTCQGTVRGCRQQQAPLETALASRFLARRTCIRRCRRCWQVQSLRSHPLSHPRPAKAFFRGAAESGRLCLGCMPSWMRCC